MAQFGHDFLHTVEKLLKECTEKREKAALQLHALRQEQQQAAQTLHILRGQRKDASTEGAQSAQCEGPAARAGSAGKSKATPTEASTAAAEPRNRAIRRALSVHISRNSSSQERGVSQRPGREGDGLKRRSSFRSKSSKTADRPEWQS